MKATLVLVLGLAALAAAQVTSTGKFTPRGTEATATFVLPALDNEQLLRDEPAAEGTYQFAHVVDVDLSLEDGIWTKRVDGSRVWKLTLRSRTARTLSVTFDAFNLPNGGELYMYTAQKLRGAFTSVNNKKAGLGTWPLRGNELTIEYVQPAEVQELPELHIAKVAHGYKTLSFGDSGRCNINAVCELGDSFRDQIRGVGMLLSQFGSRFCSGSLINNVNDDGRQLFLTAYHCSGSATDVVMFNYESSICELADQEDGPTTDTAAGLIALAEFSSSDFSLFEIEEEIPESYDVYLSGFSAVNAAPVTMYGIHHPSGDIKKICYSNETGVADWWSEAPNRFHWEVPHWDEGTTEPGSSGSPLFNADQLIIGQLHGGAASCTNIAYDSYGAVWASWDQGTEKLQTFLDPDNTGTLIHGGGNLNELRQRLF